MKNKQIKIEKNGYIFYVENCPDAEKALRQLYDENKKHPIFEDYNKTGCFSGFIITCLQSL